MKRLLLVFTVFTFFTAFSLTAQTSLILGVDAGVSFNKLKGTGDFIADNANEMYTFGYQGGLVAGVKFGGFSILTGAQYKKLGGKTEITGNWDYYENGQFLFNDDGVITNVQSYSAIGIPILLRYEFGHDFKVTLSAGPYFNVGVGEITETTTYEFSSNGRKGPNEFKSSFGRKPADLMKQTHLSFYFSPGILYKLNEDGYLKFNIGFDIGGDMKNEHYAVQGYKPSGSLKSTAFQIGIGYEHRIDFKAGTKY